VWAEHRFRRAGGDTGPYRFTRNPMYLGHIAINEAAVLLSGVALNTWTTVLFAVWLHRRFVVPEEQFLLHERGESYAAFARRVPRWAGNVTRKGS